MIKTTELISVVVLFFSTSLFAQNQTNEKLWWAGITSQGQLMPITNTYQANIINNTYGNQVQPLLLSNEGDVIWSEEPFEFKIENKEVTIFQSKGEVLRTKSGSTLKSAYLYASENYFP